MAVGLELGTLLAPYSQTFGIQITPLFVGVTVAAHLILVSVSAGPPVGSHGVMRSTVFREFWAILVRLEPISVDEV